MTNTNLNDTITSSLHTTENVEEITYAVQKLNYFTGGWHEAYLDGTLNANDRYFTINNATLRIGLNQITFTAQLENSKTIENSFYVVFYDENNLDENDSDSDGLLNWQEEFYDTDKNDSDTDNDGLNDYDEMNVLSLNPLNPDTDNDGTNDGAEDFDGEGLTNAEEVNVYNTDPTKKDTDGDTKDDYEEVKCDGTDPNKKDTDGDGVDENIELDESVRSNPLVAETVFTRTITKASTSEVVTASVVLENAQAEAVNTLSLDEVTDDLFLTSDIPGYIDNGFEFTTNGEFTEAEITFNLSADVASNSNFEPAIYYFNEEEQRLERVADQTVSNDKRTVTARVTHFSKYIVVDGNAFESLWQTVVLPSDKSRDIVVAIGRAITQDYAELTKEIYEKIVDSCSDDDQIGLVFCGSSENQTYRPLTLKSIENTEIEDIKPELNFYLEQNGTNESIYKPYQAIDDATFEFIKEDTLSRENADKYIIFIGDGSNSERDQEWGINLKERANNAGVNIVSFGVGIESGYSNENLIKDFSNEYHKVNGILDCEGLIEDMLPSNAGIDIETDENEDGIKDYFMYLICEGVILDGANKNVSFGASYEDIQEDRDYDGDGLKNGEEIELINDGDGKYHVQYFSDFTKKDSDGDGIEDLYDENPMIPSVKQDYKYGAVEYKNEMYEIYVPDHCTPVFTTTTTTWETVRVVSDVDVDFNRAKFFMGIELSDTSNDAIVSGPSSYNGTSITILDKQTKLSMGLVGCAVDIFNSVSSSFDNLFIEIELLKNKAGNRRAIIRVGALAAKNFYNQYATGLPNYGHYNNHDLGRIAVELRAGNHYEQLSGEEVKAFESYDYCVIIDPRHKNDEGYCSYMWFSNDGKLMETPIIYPEDSSCLGKWGTPFYFNFNPLYYFELRNSYIASPENSELYQEVLKELS